MLKKTKENESFDDIYTIYSLEEGRTQWAHFSAVRLNLFKALSYCEDAVKYNQSYHRNYIYFVKKVKENEVYHDIDTKIFSGWIVNESGINFGDFTSEIVSIPTLTDSVVL